MIAVWILLETGKQFIDQNAREAQDQKAYLEQYDELYKQYAEAETKLQALEKSIQSKEMRQRQIAEFIAAVENPAGDGWRVPERSLGDAGGSRYGLRKEGCSIYHDERSRDPDIRRAAHWPCGLTSTRFFCFLGKPCICNTDVLYSHT